MPRLKPKHSKSSGSSGSETTKLIRKTRQATRKRYTPEEKIRVVMEGIRGDDPVSTICRREGIGSNLYYRWLKEFMEYKNGAMDFYQTNKFVLPSPSIEPPEVDHDLRPKPTQ